MPARLVYQFAYIAPLAETNIFMHGLSEGFTDFSLRVYAGSGPGVPYPQGQASLRADEFYRHVDGTMARKIYVKNLTAASTTSAELLLLEEPV